MRFMRRDRLRSALGGFWLGMVAAVFLWLLARNLGLRLPPNRWAVLVPITILGGAGAWGLVRAYDGRQAFLARRRKGQCMYCGYDLRATQGRCPECGRRRRR
jgi:hypothetical protein